MIWWLHIVELFFLMILIYYMTDLEFNNMFKMGFNLRISKLGFITRVNVFNWNLGIFVLGVIRCFCWLHRVPCWICNRFMYITTTDDSWFARIEANKVRRNRRTSRPFSASSGVIRLIWLLGYVPGDKEKWSGACGGVRIPGMPSSARHFLATGL